MFEIKVTVDIPALDRLIPILEKYHEGRARLGITDSFADGEPTVAPYTAPDMPLPTPVTPPVSIGDPGPAVTTTTTTAPTSAPAYTLQQVATAGAELLTSNPNLLPQLQTLLQSYGATSVQDIAADKLGTFAAQLRAMGAKL